MGLFDRLFGKPIPVLSVDELQQKIKSGKHPFVLDVRQSDEYRSGHIPGAKLIPLGEIKQKIMDLPKQREIVCVCETGSRSSSASRMLASEGYQVFNLKGGMNSWQREKLPVKKGMAA
jgi:phage shock protein E